MNISFNVLEEKKFQFLWSRKMMLIPKFVSVDQVSPEALVTYSREVRAKTEKQLEPHKKLCDEWKVVFFFGLFKFFCFWSGCLSVWANKRFFIPVNIRGLLKVHAELVIVEGNEVGKSLVNQIIRLKAKKFIIGTSSRNGFLR